MLPPKISDLDNEERAKRSKRDLMFVGVGFLIALFFLIAVIAVVYCLHIFNLANVVNGNG
jgi:hypothetical protein